MVAPTWPKLPDLIEQLLAGGHGFELFQALRVIERAWAERGELGEGLDRWLRITPSADLVFPAGDLRDCRLEESGRLRLRVNALGLYGVDAPLPHYFLERATADDAGGKSLRDFLDVFGHRLYVLLYQAWKLAQGMADTPASGLSSAVDALAGQALVGEREGPAFVAAFSRRVRTAAGLGELLSEALNGMPVKVRDCQPQWLELEPAALGGEGFALGGGTALGGRVMIAAGRVRVEIGPMDHADAMGLLPDRPRGKALLALARRYLAGQAVFDLVLRVRAPEADAPRLGADGLRLGWSTWIGRQRQGEFRMRINGDETAAAESTITTAPPLREAA